MRPVWRFFASIKLTIVLAALICIVAAYGSVLAVGNQEFYRYLDQVILLPWLADKGATYPKLTGWVFALIALTTVFAVNTVVCTVDRLYVIIKRRLPAQAFFPQIVHIGFLVALLGHLAGTVTGYKTSGNILYKDVPAPVPHEQGLSMRLDDVEVRPRPDNANDIAFVRTKVTLLSGAGPVTTHDIGINNPMIYKGIAFYHIDAGQAPAGLVLEAEGRRYELGFNAALEGKSTGPYSIGQVYPDFELDPSGRATSRSGEFHNPYIEVSGRGKKGYLFMGRPGSSITLAGRKVTLVDYVYAPYAILNINKDPGIWFIIAGSAILTIGMLLLLFMRGERAELVNRRPGAVAGSEGAGE